MFLKNIPTVFELKNAVNNKNQMAPLDNLEVQAEVYKKWSLGLMCSKYNQTYFSISNEKQKDIEFVVKSKPKQQVTDFFKNVLGVQMKVPFLFPLAYCLTRLDHLDICVLLPLSGDNCDSKVHIREDHRSLVLGDAKPRGDVRLDRCYRNGEDAERFSQGGYSLFLHGGAAEKP